ncbi:MAG: YceI family protein [Alteraurantiacibacter sp.]
MRKSLFLLTAAGTLAACATAAATSPAPANEQAAVDPSVIESGTYTTDPAHTLVEWRVSHFGFNDYFGLFGDAEGTLELDADNIASSSVDIRLPITSLATVSSGLRDHMLRAGADGGEPDFFGPDPDDARFVSTSVTRTGDTTANITGTLTLNGRTAPVTIAAELSGSGDNPMSNRATIGFHGTTTLMRSEWGLDYALPAIGDAVELDITVAFEKD